MSMPAATLTFYFDVRSPYAYLAREEVLALDKAFALSVEPRPYPLELESFGKQPSPRDMRKLKYLYMDARRFANDRGLVVRGTPKIFDPRLAHAAFLYAQRSGHDRALLDKLLPAFWNRAFDIEDHAQIVALLTEIGVDPKGFDVYLNREADADLARIANEANEAGVFGVPTCVFNGELFWGSDRVAMLKRRLTEAGLAR